ncbi:MAG: hypothetical protein AAF840_14835 [Bacteroidota bacterium]
MLRISLTLALVAFLMVPSFAQKKKNKKENLWKTLSKITWKKQYDETMGFKIDFPVFSEEILALEGETVEVRGYMIPIEGLQTQAEFIFSAFPYSQCFFCGGAGPETVMEVYAKDGIEYEVSAVTLRGKLELNGEDINRLMYTITDAELVEGASD